MNEEPTEEQKRETMFWDGLAGLILLAIYLLYLTGLQFGWWQRVSLSQLLG